MCIHRMGERNQQREAAEAADSRHHADDEAEHDPEAMMANRAGSNTMARAASALSRSKGAFRYRSA